MICCPLRRMGEKRKTFPLEIEIEDPDKEPLVEKVLCAADEMKDGQKREFEVNGSVVLVIKDNGKYHCVSGLCPHYSVRLVNGVYNNGKIRCPAHGSAYDVVTGDIEDFPTFACLPTFKVFTRGSYLVLEAKNSALRKNRRDLLPLAHSGRIYDGDPIVVVGTGAAAMTFVEELRKLNCSIPIMMITKDPDMPYDRVKLSKQKVDSSSALLLHEESWYDKQKIEVKTGLTVLSVNSKAQTLCLSNGTTTSYSSLVLALGSYPKKLTCFGSKFCNVFYIRQMSESLGLWEKAKDADVVCIGGSFIGMEAASALVPIARSVTVICSTEEPIPAFGLDCGVALRKYFEKNGVRVITRGRLEKLDGNEIGQVESVHLVDGEVLPAQCVIVGIGVRPDTEFLIGTNVRLDSSMFIKVDENMQTNVSNIFAIGDATRFPLTLWEEESVHIEHFQTAQKHGQIAAHTIMDEEIRFQVVPFFWGRFFDSVGIRFSGYAENADSTIIHGDVNNFDFSKYYLKDNRVVAVASAGLANTAVTFIDIFKHEIEVTRRDVEQNTIGDWTSWLRAVS